MLRVTITVSDPWDLGEAIAWQAIRGAVAHMQADAWLVKVDSPFVHSDLEYQYLVVSPRHVDSRLERATSEQVECNIIRTTPERASSAAPCDVSWWRGGGAIIGALAAEDP
jgi:hypothetical protein